MNQVIQRLLWVEPTWGKKADYLSNLVPASTQCNFATPCVLKGSFHGVWNDWAMARAERLTDILQVKTVHWNRTLWLKMRWRWEVTVGRQWVCSDWQKMRTGRVQTVQVMHSLRLLSLASRTVAPMHSLPMLSHYKNKLLLHIKKENGDGVAAYAASVPSGADSWHCL